MGSSTLLALPGGPGFPAASLEPLALALRPRSVIVVDPVDDLADDACADHEAVLSHMLDRIETAREKTGSETVVMLGHGFGAVAATTYAAAQRDRCAALVLVNPLRTLRRDGQDLQAQRRRVEAIDPTLFDAYPPLDAAIRRARAGEESWAAVDRDPFWRRMIATQFVGAPDAAWLEHFAAHLRMAPYFGFKGAAFDDPTHPLAAFDLAAFVGDLSLPLLILASDDDANYVAPLPVHARPLFDAASDANLVVREGVGHFPFVEEPLRVAAMIERWLDR